MNALRLVGSLAALALLSGCGAEESLVGAISDSMCLTSHALDEHAAETPGDCARRCIGRGARYVLLTEGKVYRIENQQLPAVDRHAGETVRVTGRTNDDAITIAAIDAVPAS